MGLAEKGDELVEMLNDLVKINGSRADEFRKASGLIKKNPALKQMFDERAAQSDRLIAELKRHLGSMRNGARENVPSGITYKSWLEITEAKKHIEVTTILDHCEQIDEITLSVYEMVIITYAEIDFVLQTRLIDQKDSIRRSYDQLEMLSQHLNGINI